MHHKSIILWEHPTSLLAAPNSTCIGRTAALFGAPLNTNTSGGAALFRAPTKQLNDAGGGPSRGLGQASTQRWRWPFSGPRPSINTALEAALLVVSAKHQRSAGGVPSRGHALQGRSVLTNHIRLTKPSKQYKRRPPGLVKSGDRVDHAWSQGQWSSEDSDLRDNWLFD